MFLIQKLKALAGLMNSRGVPLPMVRDPKSGVGSVSLTMVVVSFSVAIVGMIGKISKLLGEVDLTQCLWLLGISCSLYFGRKLTSDSHGNVNLGGPEDSK